MEEARCLPKLVAKLQEGLTKLRQQGEEESSVPPSPCPGSGPPSALPSLAGTPCTSALSSPAPGVQPLKLDR